VRALKWATIVMGVLLVAATVALGTVIVLRLTAGPASPVLAHLQEPEGTRIAGVAGWADRLAITLQGGGTDRVVLIDTHSGREVGRVQIAH
jgi:hypothetical protein